MAQLEITCFNDFLLGGKVSFCVCVFVYVCAPGCCKMTGHVEREKPSEFNAILFRERN